MQNKEQLLKYLKQGIDALLEQGEFDGGQEFRRTQKQALEAYKKYLNQRSITTEQKLKGFFEIPTGVGKTAVFTGIVAAAHWVAENNGDDLKTVIVVPTTQLLTQTHDAFLGNEEEGKEGFAPWMEDYIGLYGDGHKSLKRPITIMTYDAWYDRSQDGSIGSHNIDILISDEAHRGTSERRIENIKGVFNGQTAQMAFTATAHFDEKKSVQASHEREIFYKSVRDAVLEGELAAYIQSQRLIIRVEPDEYMLSKEFKRAGTQKKADYRRRLRQNTWNQYALETFKNGVDERTNDPLSDNKAGFFVESTKQADDLADILNADKDLKKKAKELGCKGVAISIHTMGMSKKEQNRRFKAYLRGEYMAVVGDEKFKEGFDYPAMKTIIDSQHASVVDKAQILGRGARKFWNEDKQRYEGLTVVDTVVYIGSDDPDEDEKLRNAALRKAVSVKEILEDTYVLSPVAPAYELMLVDKKTPFPEEWEEAKAVYIQKLSAKSFAIRTFDHLGNTEDYISDELDANWVKRFNAVYKNPSLIEKDIDKKQFVEELRIALGQLASPDKNKGNGIRLFDDDPNGEYLTELQELYHLEEDISKLRRENWVDISAADRAHFKKEEERTRLGGLALFNRMETPPEELTAKIADKIVSGITQSARVEHITALKDAYSQQPNSEITSKPVRVSTQDAAFFEQKIKETNLGGAALFKRIKNPPKGLTEGKAAQIASGRTKSAVPEHISALKDAYNSLPQGFKSNYKKANPKLKPISAADRSCFQEERERTKISGRGLYATMKNPPKGLSQRMAENIVSGRTKSAVPEHISALKEAFSKISDEHTLTKTKQRTKRAGSDITLSDYVEITAKDKQHFQKEQERTGFGAKALFNSMSNPSMGQATAIRIIRGKAKSALPENIAELKDAYAKKPSLRILSKEDFLYLKTHKARTQIGGYALFNTMANPPTGLTKDKTDRILNGKDKAVLPEYFDAIKDALAALPS